MGTLRAWLFAFGALTAGCTLTLDFEGLAGQPNGAEPACSTPASSGKAGCNATSNLTPGSVGAGIAIDWKHLPKRQIPSGFIDANRLIAAVRVGQGSNDGAVLSIDLGSGRRELVAGDITNAGGVLESQGGGTYLTDISGLARLDSGKWLAHLWDRFSFHGDKVEIDPVTGDRGPAIPVGLNCSDNVFPRTSESAITSDGSIWVAYQDPLGKAGGIARVHENGCDFFPVTDASPNVLAASGSKIWFLDLEQSLLGYFEPQSGNTTIVSSPTVGSGDAPIGLGALALGNELAWTADAAPALFFSQITLANGNRAALPLAPGPAALQVENPPNIWLHPDGTRLVLELDGAITLLDPGSGKSAIISY